MRGQVSIELVLVLSLFVVMFLWTSNLASSYSGSSARASAASQQAALAASLSRLVASSCAGNASIEYAAPCIGVPAPLAVNITASGMLLNVSSPLAESMAALPCPAAGSVVLSCANETLCISPGQTVSLSGGACA